MFRLRTLTQTLQKAVRTFPAVVVTGPRQSGKTTLLQRMFGSRWRFASLENPDVRRRAIDDPRRFFALYPPPLIIDEIQYVPTLLSYIKTRIDEKRRDGQWLITGSQNFTLMQGVSQSLAGRAAILRLFPLSYAETNGMGSNNQSPVEWVQKLHTHRPAKRPSRTIALGQWLLRGGFPKVATRLSLDHGLWCNSYISTYLERDVRNLSQVGDLAQFEQFLRLCAIRTGQLLNLTEMAKEVGVSVPTAKRWLSILETGDQIYLLYPYYRNIGKRIVKRPKLYFCDTALAASLMGLTTGEMVLKSPSYGNLFETMVVIDILKRFIHHGFLPSMYYLRTLDGLEVDLVIDLNGKLHLFEVKGGMTITSHHAMALARIRRERPNDIATTAIISASEEDFWVHNDVMNYYWKNILLR